MREERNNNKIQQSAHAFADLAIERIVCAGDQLLRPSLSAVAAVAGTGAHRAAAGQCCPRHGIIAVAASATAPPTHSPAEWLRVCRRQPATATRSRRIFVATAAKCTTLQRYSATVSSRCQRVIWTAICLFTRYRQHNNVYGGEKHVYLRTQK